ncbi:MAG: polysaccharide deacetylase family protein [Clostridia bacterium]|nr:polysaccharide deacetylase family protein [Clostridia bacterium]
MRKLSFLIALLVLFSICISAEEAKITYRRTDNGDMKIALTFDDGPHPYYTAEILEILKEYNVKATFFFVGQNIENYPDAAEQVYLAGHEIGNHTYTHHRVRAMERGELVRELERCDDEIYRLYEYRTRLFRPPEGAFDDDVESIARNMDYSIILWSVDTRDWEGNTPIKIYQNVIDHVRSGDIILMHDYIGRNSPTPDALRMIIPKLIEMGYSFVSVSELISGG